MEFIKFGIGLVIVSLISWVSEYQLFVAAFSGTLFAMGCHWRFAKRQPVIAGMIGTMSIGFPFFVYLFLDPKHPEFQNWLTGIISLSMVFVGVSVTRQEVVRRLEKSTQRVSEIEASESIYGTGHDLSRKD